MAFQEHFKYLAGFFEIRARDRDLGKRLIDRAIPARVFSLKGRRR